MRTKAIVLAFALLALAPTAAVADGYTLRQAPAMNVAKQRALVWAVELRHDLYYWCEPTSRQTQSCDVWATDPGGRTTTRTLLVWARRSRSDHNLVVIAARWAGAPQLLAPDPSP